MRFEGTVGFVTGAGCLKALAIAGTLRSGVTADLLSVAEAGVPGYGAGT